MPTSVEGALVAAAIIVPAFLGMLVYSRLVVAERVTDARRLIESLVLGSWNLFVAAGVLGMLGWTDLAITFLRKQNVQTFLDLAAAVGALERRVQAASWGTAIGVCFVLPLFWAALLAWATRKEWLMAFSTRLKLTVPGRHAGRVWEITLGRLDRWFQVSLEDGRTVRGWPE